MTDIRDIQDLTLLFSKFYDALLQFPEMHRVFVDVAKIDLESHLPIIVSFWEQVIFGTGNYKSNVMQIHLHLNQQTELRPELFQLWLQTLYETADAHFQGENCERLKTRALSISQIMQLKLENSLTKN